MATGIKARITFDRLVELCRIYKDLIAGFSPENDHEELLFVHIRAFHHRLKQLAVKEQGKYLIAMSDIECTAFKQVWERGNDIPNWTEWDQLIIDSIMAMISKQFHQLKTTTYNI